MSETKSKSKLRKMEMPKRAEEFLPSDTELQDSISRRRQSAEEVTNYLAEKGYPTLGAVAGTVTDLSADLMPSTRDTFLENIGSSGITGKISKLKKAKIPPTIKAKKSKPPKVESVENIDDLDTYADEVEDIKPPPQYRGRVWRMQDAEGRGPFDRKAEWADIDPKTGDPRAHIDPFSDDVHPKVIDMLADNEDAGRKSLRYGFKSPKSAEKYFTPTEIKKLKELGYNLEDIGEQLYYPGKSQVLFEPE